MNEKMEQVHKMQLDMALAVKRICEKHHIQYFLIAGTLLGAARHKGFIPWDDDLDIGMTRNNYELFINIAQKELGDAYFLQTWDTDPGFALPCAKIRKNGTKFIEQNSSKSGLHHGIYIDIFPFDTVPMRDIKKRAQDKITYILKRNLLIKLGYEVWTKQQYFKKIIYKSLNIITKPIPTKRIIELLQREMTKYNEYPSEFVVAIGGAYGYKKETIKRSWVNELSMINFEEESFSCPKEFKEYLTYFYGDYMTTPPENKRYNRHNIIKIEFGDELK